MNKTTQNENHALKQIKRRSMMREALERLVRNKTAMSGLFILLVIAILCALAGVICPEGYDEQNYAIAFMPPCKEYPFGTDNLGRSMLARILYGGRVSGAYKLTETYTAGANAMIAVGISSVPSFAKMVRAPILAIKNQEFVEAARCIDASDWRIIFKHVVPNVLSPVIITITGQLAAAVLAASSLSFLGLGVQPPTPEWGSLIANSRQYIRDYPYLVTFPGIAIATVVLSMNLFGDGLRDALDPKLKN